MARRPRRLILDGVYHVTTRGVARVAIYHDASDRVLFLRVFRSVVHHWGWACHAYCLMGNHYHLVVETSGPRLSAGMHRLNGVYAQSFNAKYERPGHLFGDRFDARLIEGEEHLRSACRYVLANPVRAGLCKRVADWPWSWSRFGRTL